MRRFYGLLCVVSIVAMLLVAAPASAAPSATAGGSGCGQFYTVRWGDTLYRIAVRYGTTTYALMKLNGITDPNKITAGQTLCVKPGGSIPWGFLYTVKAGDTLYSIARRYGWSASYLASVNHISNPNYIKIGQVLLIPYH
jgi:peptidoglycan-N-acetylglucosamine deacetylase